MRGPASWDERKADDPHSLPPPPYHQHLLHPSPPSTTPTSPPSYSPSHRPHLPPPHPHPSDSLLALLHSASYLSLGFATAYIAASTLRVAGRTVVASVGLTAVALVGLEQAGMAEVRWGNVWRKGWGWVEANGSGRREGLWHAVRRRWGQRALDGDMRGEGQLPPSEADDELDRCMEAVEAVLTRLLSTASGVGFSLGLVFALRR